MKAIRERKKKFQDEILKYERKKNETVNVEEEIQTMKEKERVVASEKVIVENENKTFNKIVSVVKVAVDKIDQNAEDDIKNVKA